MLITFSKVDQFVVKCYENGTAKVFKKSIDFKGLFLDKKSRGTNNQ